MSKTYPVVLSVAGSDSSGGAGIQADIKTATALGCYAETAITALTAQNTQGVSGIENAAPAFVGEQIDRCFEDIPPQAVKIGMVPTPEIAHVIAERLRAHSARNIVLDPVMVATSGSTLSDEDAVGVLARELFGHAAVITPNIPETEALLGRPVKDAAAMEAAALKLAARYGCGVLVKGGHRVEDANDVLAAPAAGEKDGGRVGENVDAAQAAGSAADGATAHWIPGERVATENTHGTGCTLSTAIACGLARGLALEDAVRAAKRYLTGALSSGLALGHGNGPVDHMWQQG